MERVLWPRGIRYDEARTFALYKKARFLHAFAWFYVAAGVPTLCLGAFVSKHISVPRPFGLLAAICLIAWFVGGFVMFVADWRAKLVLMKLRCPRCSGIFVGFRNSIRFLPTCATCGFDLGDERRRDGK